MSFCETIRGEILHIEVILDNGKRFRLFRDNDGKIRHYAFDLPMDTQTATKLLDDYDVGGPSRTLLQNWLTQGIG